MAVLAFGLGTTGAVHVFVSPYVLRMRLIKNRDAKLRSEQYMEEKAKADGEQAAASAAAEQNEIQKEAEQIEEEVAKEEGDEEQEEEEEEEDEEEEEIEEFDLTGCSIEYTTLNFFGQEQTTVTDLEGLKRALSLSGAANHVTKEGVKLKIGRAHV